MRILALLLLSLCAQALAAEPKIVFIAGEYEYHSKETLPPFARQLAQDFKVETVVLERPDDPKQQTIPGLDALESADLVVLLIRRMTLPEAELGKIKACIQSGKPVIGLRTASHSFENWKSFDHEVLGGNYQGHHGNKLKTTVTVLPSAAGHPILKGVDGFVSEGSLYKNTPLQPGARPLMLGKVTGFPAEPVAWTRENQGARVFYTSLGHPDDFKNESFQNLLRNSINWALGQPLEARK